METKIKKKIVIIFTNFYSQSRGIEVMYTFVKNRCKKTSNRSCLFYLAVCLRMHSSYTVWGRTDICTTAEKDNNIRCARA